MNLKTLGRKLPTKVQGKTLKQNVSMPIRKNNFKQWALTPYRNVYLSGHAPALVLHYGKQVMDCDFTVICPLCGSREYLQTTSSLTTVYPIKTKIKRSKGNTHSWAQSKNTMGEKQVKK